MTSRNPTLGQSGPTRAAPLRHRTGPAAHRSAARPPSETTSISPHRVGGDRPADPPAGLSARQGLHRCGHSRPPPTVLPEQPLQRLSEPPATMGRTHHTGTLPVGVSVLTEIDYAGGTPARLRAWFPDATVDVAPPSRVPTLPSPNWNRASGIQSHQLCHGGRWGRGPTSVIVGFPPRERSRHGVLSFSWSSSVYSRFPPADLRGAPPRELRVASGRCQDAPFGQTNNVLDELRTQFIGSRQMEEAACLESFARDLLDFRGPHVSLPDIEVGLKQPGLPSGTMVEVGHGRPVGYPSAAVTLAIRLQKDSLCLSDAAIGSRGIIGSGLTSGKLAVGGAWTSELHCHQPGRPSLWKYPL